MNVHDFGEYIKTVHEKNTVELKEAKNALPKEFWCTYSSFSNTNGGLVVLGVKEALPLNIIQGVNDPAKILKDMWNTISNPQKVSHSSLKDSDVELISIDGKQLILIRIPEADKNFKPIYLNGHYENAYIRKGDGDYKMTDAQLRSTLRNSRPIDDSLYIDGMSLYDLDPISISSFKEKLSARYPQNHFEDYSPQAFLQRIGAIKICDDSTISIKNGTLLFFGKYEKIKEVFPSFFMDYVNRPDPSFRWIDRVSTDDLSDLQMNIYNFFNIVFEKLRISIVEKFKLDTDNTRVKTSGFEVAVREALTNCLAHADYFQGFPSIKIEASKGWISFKNPGEMLVPVKQFINGGDSRPRNETIMSFFRYLGLSERQGEGGPSIYRAALENDYRLPDITTDLERTELKLWYIDLVESHPELSEEEKSVYQFLYKSSSFVKFNEIKQATGLTEYKIRKSLDTLSSKELIKMIGNGKSTRYTLYDSSQLLEKVKWMLDSLQKHI